MGYVAGPGLMAVAIVVLLSLRPDLSRRQAVTGLGVCALAAAGAILAAAPYIWGR